MPARRAENYGEHAQYRGAPRPTTASNAAWGTIGTGAPVRRTPEGAATSGIDGCRAGVHTTPSETGHTLYAPFCVWLCGGDHP